MANCSELATNITEAVYAMARMPESPTFDQIVADLTKAAPGLDRRMIVEAVQSYERDGREKSQRTVSNLVNVRREILVEAGLRERIAQKIDAALKGEKLPDGTKRKETKRNESIEALRALEAELDGREPEVERLKALEKELETGIPTAEMTDRERRIYAQKIAREFVRKGITGRDALIDAVHAEMKKAEPDITRREAMDAISGYGDFRELDKSDDSVTMRDLKQQMQQLGKLDDMENGVAPRKSGPERQPLSDEGRRLVQQVNEKKKAGGYNITDPEKQLRSALDAIKTRLRNQIKDLTVQIERRERIVKTKRDIKDDAETTALRAERDRLRKDFEEIVGDPEITPEQRIERAKKALERSVAALDEKIKVKGEVQKAQKTDEPWSPEISVLQNRRALLDEELTQIRRTQAALKRNQELRAQVEAGTRKATRPRQEQPPTPYDAENKSLRRQVAQSEAQTKLQREIDDLQLQVRTGKFRDRDGRPTPEMNTITAALRATRKRLEREIELKKQIVTMREMLEGKRQLPTPRPKRQIDEDLEKLEFDRDRARAKVRQAVNNMKPKTAGDYFHIITRALSSLITTLEFSAVGIQGAVAAYSRPTVVAKSIPGAFKAFLSARGEARLQKAMEDHPRYRLFVMSKGHISASDETLTQREETGLSTLIDRIPGIANFGRFHRQYLNLLRLHLFDAMIQAHTNGNPTKEEARALANWANIATGRGSFGNREPAGGLLSDLGFAPRYYASRIQLLLGRPLVNAPTWAMKKAIAKEYARTLAGYGAVAALMALLGADIEDDPRSSDFGKFKFGDTRIDGMGGLSQFIVAASRVVSGETKRESGVVVKLYGDEKPRGSSDVGDVISRFARSKMSPGLSVAFDMATRETFMGEPTTLGTLAKRFAGPITYKDITEVLTSEMGYTEKAAKAIVAFFVPIQHYGEGGRDDGLHKFYLDASDFRVSGKARRAVDTALVVDARQQAAARRGETELPRDRMRRLALGDASDAIRSIEKLMNLEPDEAKRKELDAEAERISAEAMENYETGKTGRRHAGARRRYEALVQRAQRQQRRMNSAQPSQ